MINIYSFLLTFLKSSPPSLPESGIRKKRQGGERNGAAVLSRRRTFVKQPVGRSLRALVALAAMAVCVGAQPAAAQTDDDNVRMIPLAPQVEVLPQIGAVDVEVRALGAEAGAVEVAAGGESSVLIASDADGTLMLAAANEDGGYLGEGPGAVQLGIESTAITLVAVASGRRFGEIDPQLAQAIRSHEEFGRLTRLLESLMASDKNYLDRLYSYPQAVTLIKSVAAGVASANAEPTAEAAPGFKQLPERDVAQALAAAGDVTAYNSESGPIAAFYKEDFYCIPGSGLSFGLIPCSPWNDREPWHWYGEALGVRALFPDNFLEWVLFLVSTPLGLAKEYAELVWQSSGALPFPAVAEGTVRGCQSFFSFLCGDDDVHATANPNFVNYAMELYEDGVYRDWFYTPGNSTMTDKLLNSGAAYREFRTGPKRTKSVLLSPDIDVVRFQRYRFSLAEGDERGVDRGVVVSFMNTLRLVIAAVNVITDVSEVREVFKNANIVNLAEPIAKCSAEVGTAVGSAFPGLIVDGRIVLDADPDKEVQDLLLGSLVNLGPAYLGALQSQACQNLLTQAVKGGVKKSVVKKASSVVDDLFRSGSRQALKTAADAALFWAKLGFDVANEAIPVGLAYFRPAGDRVDYHLFWKNNPQEIPYIHMVSKSRPPTAQFTYTQRGGFRVELDGSQTTPGDSDDLTFSWRVNGADVGRGERFVHDFGAAGRYRVEVVVVDGNGLSGTFSSGVEVNPGSIPEVSSLECTPTRYDTFRMVASFSDADGDIETVEWRSDAGSVDPNRVTTAGTTQVEMRATSSTAWASVTVEDAVGNRGSRVCNVNLEYVPVATVGIDSLSAACGRKEPWRACYHRAAVNQGGLVEFSVSMPRDSTGTWHAAWCVKEERAGLCDGRHDRTSRIDKGFSNVAPLTFPMTPPEGAETFWVVAEVRECNKALCNWPEDFTEVEFHHIEVSVLPPAGGTGGNRAPELYRALPNLTLQVGGSAVSVSMDDHFRDPEGGQLTYGVSITPTGIVRATDLRNTDTVEFSPVSAGTATATVTARDPRGLETRGMMEVRVNPATNTEDPEAGETRVFDGIEFVWVPPGEFVMGSTSRHANTNEQPLTRVRLTRGFWMGRYEVTQAQWQAVMGENPSWFKDCGGDCPVERVSWNDVQEFIGKLNARSGGRPYRLPTEAEWEYAARAGTSTDTYAGDITQSFGNDPVLNGIAWYRENSGSKTQPVGRKAPNAWGLYDMLGNVWEWTGDWFGYYRGGSVTDPVGPRSGSGRVGRGGGWGSNARGCRSASRSRNPPGIRSSLLGFRLLREQ